MCRFTRAFWFIVHENYARLERIRVVNDVIAEHMRRRLAGLGEGVQEELG